MWVDFKALRKSLSFEAVLEHYGVTIRRRPGNRHVGFCPLPNHQGKKKSPSFSAKLDYGVFQCFGCKASGHILTFAALMENLNPDDPNDLRKVALRLQEQFGTPNASAKPATGPAAARIVERAKAVLVNPPLDFDLKDLDAEHPYLRERGFELATAERFGIGYCNRGLMKGRIVIPLHDEAGRLIGYAGRITDDQLIGPDCPKYLLPGRRERQGTVIEFKKSLFLYRAHELPDPLRNLILVEGFPSTWWLKKWRYAPTVALMGSDCSPEQADWIVRHVAPTGRVWIFTDQDEAGDKCALRVFQLVGTKRWCKRVSCKAIQPTDCTPGDLSELLWPV